MKKLLSVFMAMMLLCLACASCGGSKIHHVEVDVENYGKITLAIDEKSAPITAKNFIKLVKQGYYDGLSFIRVQKGFVIQGGQSDKPADTIKGEFAANGVNNTLSHKKGVISMARAKEYNSASTQFFIMLADNTYLDGQYAAFGWVEEGMDIIEKICNDITDEDFADTQFYFLKEESRITITKMTLVD